MAQQIINNGMTGLTVRNILNQNFTELYQGKDAVTVNTFADLPAPATATGQRWWVLQSSGVWLVNRKQKGAYYSDGSVWSYLGDFPQSADEVSFTPTGTISATDVQGAITEVATDANADLTAGLATKADTSALTSGLAGKANTGAITLSGLTQATARMLGRSTAGTGAVEEISVGAGLTLSGGVLSGSASSSDAQATYPFLDTGSGTFFPACFEGGSNSTLAQVANTIRLFAFVPGNTFVVDQVGLSISTLAAGTNLRVLIYASDPTTKRPTNLLLESPNISGGAAATVFANITFTLTKGVLYWIGVYSDGTPTIRTVATTASPILGISNAATPAYNRLLTQAATFGSAPTTWSFSSGQLANIAVPLVIFRRA